MPDIPTNPRYLNVDLDVHAMTDPQVLMDHWAKSMIPLVEPADTGEPFVRFELYEPFQNAADTIRCFCDAVEELPPHLLQFWQECPERRLDIGYDSGQTNPLLVEQLPAELLARVAQHFTGLVITIYPVE
jgi:hypothetical protein